MCMRDPFFKRYLTLAQRRGLWDFDQPPLGCVVAIARFKVALPTEWIHPHSFPLLVGSAFAGTFQASLDD